MKIQLASTLPFTPVQLDARHTSPRRMAGQVQGVENFLEYRLPVYQFRHDDQGSIQYQVDLNEKVFIDEDLPLSARAANDSSVTGPAELVWIDHEDALTYKPYSFLIMDAMTRLVGTWDGVVYRTPSGERLRESAFQATLQIVDACVCPRDGLWVMVSLAGDSSAGAALNGKGLSQMGWVPIAC